MKINVASWNIWVHGLRDHTGMARVIGENEIDIIGLQEAGVYFDKNNGENIAEKIAGELGFNCVFYPAFDGRPKKSWIIGNAIISRYPITASESRQLNPPGVKYDGTALTEPRILAYSKIRLDKNKSLNFLTTHLQFSVRHETTDLRLAQVENILSTIKKLGSPVVLTGDFNTVPGSPEIKKLENFLTRLGGDEPTWSVYPWERYGWRVDGLKYRIDNIFISKDLECEKSGVIDSKISDHLAIKAAIDV